MSRLTPCDEMIWSSSDTTRGVVVVGMGLLMLMRDTWGVRRGGGGH